MTAPRVRIAISGNELRLHARRIALAARSGSRLPPCLLQWRGVVGGAPPDGLTEIAVTDARELVAGGVPLVAAASRTFASILRREFRWASRRFYVADGSLHLWRGVPGAPPTDVGVSLASDGVFDLVGEYAGIPLVPTSVARGLARAGRRPAGVTPVVMPSVPTLVWVKAGDGLDVLDQNFCETYGQPTHFEAFAPPSVAPQEPQPIRTTP